MSLLKRFGIAGSCVALAVGGGLSVRIFSPAETPTLVLSSFSEMFSSETPVDWATSADHVAEVTVVGESAGRREAGSIERIVALQVDAIHWSRVGAKELPTSFSMPAFGWAETDSGRAELAAADTPRMEPDHHYLVALILLEPRCNADDGLVLRGGWSVIGSGGVLPLDRADIGFGEIEGTAKQSITGLPGTMRAAAETARDVAALVDLVEQATPADRPAQPGVREGC